MAKQSSSSGCFIVLVVFAGLVFWPITLVLIFIFLIAALLGSVQNQAYTEDAGKWQEAHNRKACVYSGKYGFIHELTVDNNKLLLSILPVRSLLPGSSGSIETFSIKIVDGSFRMSIHRLFAQNFIKILQGVSVELSAIETALKCQQQIAWCDESMNSLVKMSDHINNALFLAPGNQLLEPSIPRLEKAKARITEESFSITNAKEYSFKTLKDLIDFLSVPEELRQPSSITELDNLISIRHNDLKTSFQELLEFNREYEALIQ